MPIHSIELRLAERPVGQVNSKTFTAVTVPLPPALQPGYVIVQVDWLSMDPAMRGWLDDKRSYLKPVQVGEKMRAQGLGTVVDSSSVHFKAGDLVRGIFGMLFNLYQKRFPTPPHLYFLSIGWCTYTSMAEKDVELIRQSSTFLHLIV